MRIPLAFAGLSHADGGFRSGGGAATRAPARRLIRIKARFSQSRHDFAAEKARLPGLAAFARIRDTETKP
jgi:hypothetical protein